MTDAVTEFVATPLPIHSPEAQSLIRAYFFDIGSRYWGREVTPAEVDAVIIDEPNDDLAPPSGDFFVLRDGTEDVGCVGVRRIDPHTCELTRLFVAPHARGRGAGRALIAAVERSAREFGARTLRLDTRSDLTEARALYAACGFAEIPRFNDDEYAEHWFAKALG
ncbi:MAG: GNAT family N-acetyltransferase [Actinophytocola sp.]|nr:GNAT family N-acetyltransferase [Actinophytocola sp.]